MPHDPSPTASELAAALAQPTAAPVRRAFAVLEALRTQGYDAAIVGGAVRDVLRGAPIADVDIATDAPTLRLGELLGLPMRTTPRGATYGAVIVTLPDGEAVDVMPFREDLATDGRHAVTRAGTLDTDLQRRDFTINAMALRGTLASPILVDPWGGARDLGAGRLRSVGPAAHRLAEDALRALRAYRFAARLGLVMDAALRAALPAAAPSVGALITGPRRMAEWRKLAQAAPGPRWAALEAMAADGVLRSAFGGDLPTTMAAVPDGRWTPGMLLGLVWREAAQRRQWGDTLGLTREERQDAEVVSALWTTHRARPPEAFATLPALGAWWSAALPARWCFGQAAAVAEVAVTHRAPHPLTPGPIQAATVAALEAVRLRGVQDLPVGTADLRAHGVPDGPALGEVQRALLAWALEDLPTRHGREAILGRLRMLQAPCPPGRIRR